MGGDNVWVMVGADRVARPGYQDAFIREIPSWDSLSVDYFHGGRIAQRIRFISSNSLRLYAFRCQDSRNGRRGLHPHVVPQVMTHFAPHRSGVGGHHDCALIMATFLAWIGLGESERIKQEDRADR